MCKSLILSLKMLLIYRQRKVSGKTLHNLNLKVSIYVESNQRKLTATFQTLHLICKANPELLVNHITSIAYYLSSDLTVK